MDIAELKNRMICLFKKYRYAAIVILSGLILMIWPELPEQTQSYPEVTEKVSPELHESLADLLSLVAGAGKVEVLLTLKAGEYIDYQTDTNRSQDTLRSNTVVVTDAERKETGLIKQVISPQYRGAVILCQGADNANVRLSIMDAVKSATGLTYDRITILKMK